MDTRREVSFLVYKKTDLSLTDYFVRPFVYMLFCAPYEADKVVGERKIQQFANSLYFP